MPQLLKVRLIAAAVAVLTTAGVIGLNVGDGPGEVALHVRDSGTGGPDAEHTSGDGSAAEVTTSSTLAEAMARRDGVTTSTRRTIAGGVATLRVIETTNPVTPTVTTRPRPSAPMGCDAVDAAIAASRPERHIAAGAADQSSRPDRLGEYLLFSEPHANSTPGYHGPVSRDDMAASQFQAWETRAMLDEHGYAAGYIRSWTWEGSWSHDDGGAALVLYVYEFASSEHALAFEDEAIHRLCQETAEVFATPGVAGGFGVSFRNMGGPPVTERVSFVRGPRYYVVAVESHDPPAEHGRVLDFAHDEAGIAR